MTTTSAAATSNPGARRPAVRPGIPAMKLRWGSPAAALGLLAGACLHAATNPPATVFPSPQDAVAALDRAVSTTNRAALIQLFGPAAHGLINPDEVQGAAEFAQFAAAFSATNRLVADSDTKMTLEVGPDLWPFAIPLCKVSTGWQFDGPAGLEELLNRRIGRNELYVLKVLRACVAAQREYAAEDRNGDEVLEYAQSFSSAPGRTDGLYWPPEVNGVISPLGPLIAEAQDAGYFPQDRTSSGTPQPFHGYYFRILTRQGRNVPGGAYNYIINRHMIAGFAFLAWPAEYGQSGIMTFVVNQQGRVYQKDLGPNTAKIARGINEYHPDQTWQVSPD